MGQQLLHGVSSCIDVNGDITRGDCQAKGTASGQNCMWTSYKTEAGLKKSMCGPCKVEGVGELAPYMPHDDGPEPGSKVEASYSQCQEVFNKYGLPCDPINGIAAVTPCKPTPAPEYPGGLPPPVSLDYLGLSRYPGAPEYVAVPVPAPYDKAAYTKAATTAAQTAGWPVGSLLPPSVHVAVLGPPPLEGPTLPPDLKFEYVSPPPGLLGLPQATPPPSGFFAVPVPGAAPAAAPPASLIETSSLSSSLSSFSSSFVAGPTLSGGVRSAVARRLRSSRGQR